MGQVPTISGDNGRAACDHQRHFRLFAVRIDVVQRQVHGCVRVRDRDIDRSAALSDGIYQPRQRHLSQHRRTLEGARHQFSDLFVRADRLSAFRPDILQPDRRIHRHQDIQIHRRTDRYPRRIPQLLRILRMQGAHRLVQALRQKGQHHRRLRRRVAQQVLVAEDRLHLVQLPRRRISRAVRLDLHIRYAGYERVRDPADGAFDRVGAFDVRDAVLPQMAGQQGHTALPQRAQHRFHRLYARVLRDPSFVLPLPVDQHLHQPAAARLQPGAQRRGQGLDTVAVGQARRLYARSRCADRNAGHDPHGLFPAVHLRVLRPHRQL